MTEVDKTLNQRYAEFKVDVQKQKFTPHGYNPFAQFNYFDLPDFYPQVMQLLLDHGLVYWPPVYEEDQNGNGFYVATLETFDGLQQKTFKEKAVMPNHSKNDTQNYGGMITYYERFILKKIAGIVDKDEIDAIDNSKNEPRQEQKATDNQISLIEKLYDTENIEKIKDYYKVENLKDLTLKQASAVLEKKNKK